MLDALESVRERLAPHYDVVREIGAGGMARVYLALEQHPQRRVAIKVLAPELGSRLLRERFLREVDLSSKLSHPHIVPIFSAGEAGGLFYYVMPYVEGESLRLRLLRERKLAFEDALHIARDVADALAFAHAQGVIHRDIKPENILLSGGHAIVADFGIARAISAAGAPALTQTGQSVGSPGYMSPEQALGVQLDARTDIYSLGCVLFEALTGEPPVPSLGERRIRNWTALKSSDVLRQADARVMRAVRHAISRALSPLPDDRFATATEFAAAVGGTGHRTSVPTRGVFAGRRGRRIALASAGTLVLLGAAGVHLLRTQGPRSNERRVAVAVIENHTGDRALDNLGYMAADWVTQGLAQTGLVEVVPSISVMTSSLAPTEHGPAAPHLDAAAIRALGRETSAGTVVWGAYYRQGDSIRFQVQISAAEDGKVLRALDPVAGPLTQPLTAVEALRQRVMAALATLFDSRLNRWATSASQPPNFQAYQEFIGGLDRFVQFDMRGAIAHFERAAAVDTTFRLPLIFAANAYMNLGRFAAADSLAHVAERHSERLAPLDRFYLAWVLAICRGDRAEAFRASRAMVSVAPASEALYLVAEDAMALNRPREAVNALTALGPDRGFTRGWWIYWDDLTGALHMLGDHRSELKQALEGIRRFPHNLQILTTQVRALAALGRTEDVGRLLAASVNFSPELGLTSADAMMIAAAELRAHGYPAAADTALGLARNWLAGRSPAESESDAHRYCVALVAYAAGRLDDARREFERLVARGSRWTAATAGDAPDQMDYLGYLGAIAARQGDRGRALRVDSTLAGLKRPYLFGQHTMWRARIHALLGERERAIALLWEALGQGYPHFHGLHTDLAFASLRDYPPFEELVKPKP